MAKKARVLVAGPIGLITYRANDVIELDDKLAAQYEKQGVIDTNPAAVAYAIEEGAEVQKHVSPKKSSHKNDQDGIDTGQDGPLAGSEGTPQGNVPTDDPAGTETNTPA